MLQSTFQSPDISSCLEANECSTNQANNSYLSSQSFILKKPTQTTDVAYNNIFPTQEVHRVGVTVPAPTWLLWMEMAQASLSGSCCRLKWIPPPDLNTQRSGFSTSVMPYRKRTRGSPEEAGKDSVDENIPPLLKGQRSGIFIKGICHLFRLASYH